MRLRRGFGVVSKNVLRDPTIPMAAKALYALMCTYADDDGVCTPGNATLAADLDVTERYVQQTFGVLVAAGVVDRESRFNGGRQTSSITLMLDANSSGRGEPGFTHEGEQEFVQNKTSKNKTSNTPPTPQGGRGDGFDQFWSLYPRHDGGKTAVRRKWDTVTKTTEPEVILTGLRRQLAHLHREATREPGKNYCPMPTTWLNQGRWEDEAPRLVTNPAREVHPR